MKNIKRILALVLVTVTFCMSAMTASAYNNTRFDYFMGVYISMDGKIHPEGITPETKSNYKKLDVSIASVNKYIWGYVGTERSLKGIYVPRGLSFVKIDVSELNLKKDQTVHWYYIRQTEDDDLYIVGVIGPVYSIEYQITETRTQDHYVPVTKNGNLVAETISNSNQKYIPDGKTLKCWNTKPDGSGKNYKPGDSIKANAAVFGDGRTLKLYPVWKDINEITEPEVNTNPGGETVKPENPTKPANGKSVNLKIVAPKKMAIRFGDGKRYYNGDTARINLDEPYYFQMCSVNWDTGIYSDRGDGICGTVVYSVKVSKNYTKFEFDEFSNEFRVPAEDPTLRTDVNKCFMAYRFHFAKGDYDKQTGIEQVVNTPLESLSVNLPLGATINIDAYKSMKWALNGRVFIENNNGRGIYNSVYMTSVNDYYWQY